ncbi:uncharacterized protein BYT42DRAFT_196579 [Radiomyces spectabilis]|uniref:uncharacterized protein n=1 Tax=Radiomyces spectabilis TaxID=64574 RepID=UPI0022208FD6|nr:uncharacterized protein BYT42DRAFT_196579 [Radiomyces spectabilis]KAI8391479.1 hypothetical protein BYT42DRAFT_196579 [Radiomyces spectabilis]
MEKPNYAHQQRTIQKNKYVRLTAFSSYLLPQPMKNLDGPLSCPCYRDGKRCQRRPISHDEIGWAIIYCSTSLLCNPTVPKAPAASAPREQTPISPPAVPQSPPAAPHSPPSTTQGSLIRESASLADMFDDFIGDDGPRSPPPAVVNTSPPQPAPATTVPLIEPSSSSALDATSSSTPASLSKKRRQLPFSSQNIEPLLSQTMEPQDSVEETSTRRTRPRLSSKEPHETTAPQHLIADTEPGGIDIDLDLDLPTTTVDMDPPRETVTVETHNESRGHPRETTPLALPQTPRGRGTASKRQNKRNTRTTNIPTSALNLWNDNEAQASEHAPESGNDEEEEIIPGKQYSVIEFAAIVRPPAAAPSSHSSNEGINYKRFRKVQPIQPPDFMDFVPMTLSDAEIRTRQGKPALEMLNRNCVSLLASYRTVG